MASLKPLLGGESQRPTKDQQPWVCFQPAPFPHHPNPDMSWGPAWVGAGARCKGGGQSPRPERAAGLLNYADYGGWRKACFALTQDFCRVPLRLGGHRGGMCPLPWNLFIIEPLNVSLGHSDHQAIIEYTHFECMHFSEPLTGKMLDSLWITAIRILEKF